MAMTERRYDPGRMVHHITTMVTDAELTFSINNVLDYVVERNVKRIVAANHPALEKIVMDALFSKENRGQIERLIHLSIERAVEAVIRELLTEGGTDE